MIQRRQFIGSISTFAAFSATGMNLFGQENQFQATQKSASWQSRVIQTIPHGRSYRAPVVTSVCAQPQGNLLAIVGDDHFVSIFDLLADRYLHHIGQHKDWVRSAEFSSDGNYLATAGNDRNLFVWNSSNFDHPEFTKQHPSAILDLAISNDVSQIATVGFENPMRIYDLATAELIRTVKCPCVDMRSVTYSNDSQLIAAGGRNGKIRVWNAADGEQVTQVEAHRQRIRSLDFMADGRILSCSEDQIVKVTDLNDSTNSFALPRQRAKLFAIQLIDQETLATAGSDNLIRLWNLKTRTELGVLKGHTGTVSCLDITGETLVSGSYDTHVRLWNLQNKTAMLTPPTRNSVEGWTPKFK